MDETLQGLPSPEETMRVLYGAQQASQPTTTPQPAQQSDWASGFPSPEETMRVLYEAGYQPGRPNTFVYQSGLSPVQQDQRTQQDYTNVRAGQIINERQDGSYEGWNASHAFLAPAVQAFGTHGLTNPFLSGAQGTEHNFMQLAAIPMNLATGEDVSGAVLDERAAQERAAQNLRGDEPFHERFARGVSTAVGDIATTGGLGKIPYLSSMFARTYDQSLQEADREGIQGPQKHAYATVNGAVEVGAEYAMQRMGKGVMGKIFPKTPQDPTGGAQALKQTLRQRLWDIGKTAGEEGLEEAVTQVVQNANAIAHGIKPATRESLFEGVGEAALIGAGAGGVIGGIDHAGKAMQQRKQQVTPQNPGGEVRPPWAPPANEQSVSPPIDTATNPPPAQQEAPPNVPTRPVPVPSETPEQTTQAPPPATEVAPLAGSAENKEAEAVGWKHVAPAVREKLKRLGLKYEEINTLTEAQINQKLGLAINPQTEVAPDEYETLKEKIAGWQQSGMTLEQMQREHPEEMARSKELFLEKRRAEKEATKATEVAPAPETASEPELTLGDEPEISAVPPKGWGTVEPTNDHDFGNFTRENLERNLGPRGFQIGEYDPETKRFEVTTPIGSRFHIELTDKPIKLSKKQHRTLQHTYGMTPEQAESVRIAGRFSNSQGILQIYKHASEGILDHEMVHAAHRWGLFTEQEWNGIVHRYSDPSRSEGQQSEDIAQALHPTSGKGRFAKDATPEAKSLFPRLAKFAKELASSLGFGSLTEMPVENLQKLLKNPEFWARSKPEKVSPQNPGKAVTTEQPEAKPAEPPKITGQSLTEFATAVQKLADAAPPEHGDDLKAMIAPLYEASQRDPSFPRMTLEQFKDRLVEAKGQLGLSSMDMMSHLKDTGDARYGMAVNSEISHMGGAVKWHAVNRTPQNSRKAITGEKPSASEHPAEQHQLFATNDQPGLFGKQPKRVEMVGEDKPPEKPPVAKTTESPADTGRVTQAEPLVGQKSLVTDEWRAAEKPPEPAKKPEPTAAEKRSEASKAAAETVAKQKKLDLEERIHNRVVVSEGVDTDELAAAVDRQIQAEEEHWNALNDIVDPHIPKTPKGAVDQRKLKELQNHDEMAVKGLDEIRGQLEGEHESEAAHSGVSFDEFYNALSNGMPREPSASNEEFVREVASNLKREQEEAGDASFNPDEFVRETEDRFFNTKGQPQDNAKAVFDALKKLAGPTNKHVDVRDWRKATGLSKQDFDAAALDLFNKGHVMPQRGEALGLSPEKVAEMVHRPLPAEQSRGHGEHAPGEYYVTAKPVANAKPYNTNRTKDKTGKKQPVPTVAINSQGPSPEKPISVHDIRSTLAKWFNTAFLRGRVPKGGEAFYKWQEEVSRVAGKEWGNLAIITHELGHHLDKTNKDMLNGFSNSAKAELAGMDYDTNRKSFQEGFAELVRLMLTTDSAASQAPVAHKEFTDWLTDKKNADTQKKLWGSYLLMKAYRAQHPLDRIMANWWESGRKAMAMKVDPKTGKISFDVGTAAERFWEFKDRIMAGGYGETYIAEKVAAEAEAQMLKEGKTLPRTRAGELINFMHGSDRAMAEHAIFHGIYTMSHGTDAAPTKLSDGMFDILKTIDTDGKWADFWSWYDAKAAESRMARLPDYNPGMLESDVKDRIAEVDADKAKAAEFDKVGRDVRKFLGALVQLEQDGGIKEATETKRILDSEEFYLPRFRIREHGLLGGVRQFASDVGKRMFGVKSSVQKVSKTGSADAYATPFDAIIRQTMQTYNAVTHQAIKSAMIHVLDPQLGGAEGMGKYLTRVDPAKVLDRVKLEKLLDGLTKPGEINGVATDPVMDQQEAERLKKVDRWRDGNRSGELRRYLTVVFNLNGRSATLDKDIDKAIENVPGIKQSIAFWKGDFGENADEHIIRFLHNGTEIFYQMPYAPLYDAVMGQGNSVNATVFSRLWVGIANGWNKVFTTPVKLGAVTLNPAYIGPAAIMDYVNFTLHSKHTGPIERFFAPIHTLGQLIAAKLTGKDHALVRVLDEYGGKISSQRFGAPSSSSKAITKEIRAKTPMDRLKSKLIYDTFETIKDFVGTADTGMRLAEAYGVARGNGFTLTADKTKWNYPNGSVHEDIPVWLAIKMVNASNEVLTNFKRKGYVSRELDKIVPFLSAGIAGSARALETTRDIATRGEGWEKRAMAACALATGSLMYAWFHKDDEEREGLDRNIADRYWTFKAFGFDIVRIPKPRGFLWIPNMMEAFVDLATKGKTDRTANALWTTIEDILPPMRPSGASTIWDISRNKDWTGKAIEQQSDRDRNIGKEYRDTQHTLGTTKAMAQAEKAVLGEHMQAWGLSPVQIEYILDQWTGSAYSDYVGGTEKAVQGKFDPVTAPVMRRFTFKSLHQRSVNEFYDDYEKVKGRANTAKELGQEDAEAQLQMKQMDRYKDALTDMRKVLKTAVSTKEKLASERYLVGIADYAQGAEQRNVFPNPLRKDAKDLPKAVDAIRKEFVVSLARSIAAEPSPKSIRSPEDLKKFKERAAADDAVDRWAVGELKRLGYSQQDVLKEFVQANIGKGRKPSSTAMGRIVAEMGKKD